MNINVLGYGICRLSIVPIRLEASDKSEMVSQLLFGEHYRVIGSTEAGNWLQIQMAFDDYQGWIDSKQHFGINQEYFDQIAHSDFKVCLDVASSILYKKSLMPIVIGSILPISSHELFSPEEHLAFNGESKSMGQKREYDFLKQTSLKYLNAPYLWGGKSPFGIDCSGFTQQVYKICGYALKRDAWQQAGQGQALGNLAEAQAGDLLFFTSKTEKISHVGILMQDQHLIHASGKVRIDLVDEKGIVNIDTQQRTHQLKEIRRILKK